MKCWREDPGRHMGKVEKNQKVLEIVFHERLREFGSNILSLSHLKVHLVSSKNAAGYSDKQSLYPDPWDLLHSE